MVAGRFMRIRTKFGTCAAFVTYAWLACAGFAFFVAPAPVSAQAPAQGRGGAPAAPRTPKAAAPIDLTGYWVSIVTEDWRYRMVTPAKGDYPSIPLNAEARKIADAWDPSKDEADGNQCKAYGAGNITRQPGRLHITWDGETVLKVEA